MSRFCCQCCDSVESKRFLEHPDVDWVGQVLHERMLADLDAAAMREQAPAQRRATLNLRFARLGDQARTRGTQQLSFEC
jgi:hypothetical protein